MIRRPIVVRIEFPALDSLIAYLTSRDQAQAQIDSAAQALADATARLKQPTDALQEAIKEQ